MTTQKRRVVYLSDEEWEGAKVRAARLGMTVSAYIRSSVVGGSVIPPAIHAEFEAIARPMTQAERDAILRKINRGG